MTDRHECELALPLLAELATGAATGYDRARALLHVSHCPNCRRELAQLSKIADELLLLAPAHEPPAGFESRVMASIAEGAPPPRPPATRRRPAWLRRPHRISTRIVVSTLAVAIGGVLGAGAVWQATSSDRHFATEQREVMEIAKGRYFTAFPITDGSGVRTGTAFLYQGDPSWVLIDVQNVPDGDYNMVIVDRDGISHPSGTCTMRRGWGTYGYRLWEPVSEVSVIQLNGPIRLTARS
jgi:hypothetical protein